MTYRTLAERIVGATNDERMRSMEAVAIAERLITAHFAKRDAAARRLVAAVQAGAQANTPDFLDWLADRLVHVYGENPNVDFVLSARERAASLRTAADALAALLPEEPQ